jgi:hypothetical protein
MKIFMKFAPLGAYDRNVQGEELHEVSTFSLVDMRDSNER